MNEIIESIQEIKETNRAKQRIIALDATMLNTLQACSYKLNLQFILNLRGLTKPHYLDEGSLIHLMLWMYYQLKREGVPFQTRVEQSVLYGRLMSPGLDLGMDDCEVMYYQFKEYCRFWEFETWSPIDFERPFSIVIYEDENLKVLYEGVVDLIVYVPDIGELIVDHKTMTRNTALDQMSNQFMGYSYGLGIRTVCINRIGFQKTLPPKKRFTRPYVGYNSERLEEWKANVIHWAKRVDGEILDGQFPMNQTSCDKYGGCFYKPLCISPVKARSYLAMRDYKIGETWAPAGGLGLKGEVDDQA
jgi:hypothetical protein